MRLALTVFFIATLSLGACSSSRGNDDIYGVPGDARVDPNSGRKNVLIPQSETIFDRWRARKEIYEGTPVDQIASVQVDKTAGGIIVQVAGLPLRQGAFDVRLVNDTKDKPVNGVMTYTLKALQPVDTPQGEDYLRQVNAGVFISNENLSEMRSIRIVGARNQRVIRR